MVEKETTEHEDYSPSSGEGGERRSLEVGQAIVQRLRRYLSEEQSFFVADETEDLFESLYLTERGGCVPDNHLGENLMTDIINLYYPVLDAVREELKQRLHIPYDIWVHVVPSYEDETHWLMVTEEKVLLSDARNAWWFWWQFEEAMAEELQEWYRKAASRLAENHALLGDRNRWALRETLFDLHLSALPTDQCPESHKEPFNATAEHREAHLERARNRLEVILRGEPLPEEKVSLEDEHTGDEFSTNDTGGDSPRESRRSL